MEAFIGGVLSGLICITCFCPVACQAGRREVAKEAAKHGLLVWVVDPVTGLKHAEWVLPDGTRIPVEVEGFVEGDE